MYMGRDVGQMDRAGALKTRNWTSRNLTMRHHIARVDNARPENAVPDQTEVLESTAEHSSRLRTFMLSRDQKPPVNYSKPCLIVCCFYPD